MGTCDWSYAVRASRNETFTVIRRSGILSEQDTTLANVLCADDPMLVVTTPTVDRFYGDRLRRYLSANVSVPVSHLVLACSESRKGMEQVLAVCDRAAEARLARRSQIVCVGGGVSLDLCGLAATLFRRGIRLVRVPTTLIGMIDAGIGVKNGINFGGSKSLLGAFSTPEACIIDPSFLATLPRRHLQCGLAESIKIATMCSPELFARLEDCADWLLREDVGLPYESAEELIQLSVYWTLEELKLNLFERNELFSGDYARKLDFGHTFSPYLEAASGHRLLHGEAVAIDMALAAEVAHSLGVLDDTSRSRIVSLLRRLDLPISYPDLNAAALFASLESIVRHRNGNLNLVLPSGIGSAVFLSRSDLNAGLFEEAARRLSQLSEVGAGHWS
jgi:3-dehydroquinate synthase